LAGFQEFGESGCTGFGSGPLPRIHTQALAAAFSKILLIPAGHFGTAIQPTTIP
jgi:hypothetical protein